ncbi:endo-1,4-beta-xylanase [Paludisphaera rhizosphaerae]|uniref:endo-1,4-beta-xylanase n=1 Tax=Paludisphaera rhizosphaerae TaxID=2711216 RepID=UPI0013ED43F7|nr:endo-1,4-beta-xylanase [Paludisphaera rhizosphaerae]
MRCPIAGLDQSPGKFVGDGKPPGRIASLGAATFLLLAALISFVGPARAYGQSPAGSLESGATTRSLRRAVEGRFLIGTAVSSRQLREPRASELIADQFDVLTAENEFKPRALQPQPGVFNFEAADAIVEFARKHDQKVVGHTLCWHSQAPSWMFRGPDGKPLPRDEALRNLKTHIDKVVGRYRGKVVGWDVVNEAISDNDGEGRYLRDTPARQAIGDDYIAQAFEFAHAADPDAELYYNDYGNETPGKLERTLRLVRELKARNVRLDAVGIQSHFRLDDPTAVDRLDRAITAYASEGVKIVVSELDVDVLPRRTRGADVAAREQRGADPYTNGLPPDVAASQAQFYDRLFRVLLKHPGVVSRVTFWGVHDGSSWLNFWPVFRRTNHPLLWDRDLRPKPAFDAVFSVLTNS